MDSSLGDHQNIMVLVGPTGSGKSGLAIALAQRFPIELVCMDAMQLYREIQIGVAAPAPEEKAQVPHHLFGEFSLEEPVSSVQFAQRAAEVTAEIRARGHCPLFVGGTGLYMRALFEGLPGLPTTPPALRERLNTRVETKGLARLYRLLRRLDPQGAEHLHPNDKQRIIRFLEVRILSGRSMLQLWEEQQGSRLQPPLTLGLDIGRPDLLSRLQKRTADMLAHGWIAEVEQLKQAGMAAAIRSLKPIGYPEILDFLEGKLDEKGLREKIAIATRRYAKRQMTWFRRLPYIRWFPYEVNVGYNIQAIESIIRETIELP